MLLKMMRHYSATLEVLVNDESDIWIAYPQKINMACYQCYCIGATIIAGTTEASL
jgi:hypothetical protein